MRYEELLERDQSLLSVSTKQVMDRLRRPARDMSRSWLQRAFDALPDQHNPDPRFLAMLRREIKKAQIEVWRWTTSPTPLMRGLSRPPKGRLGRHWTTYADEATIHGRRYVMVADVSPNMIDWTGTIIRRISWSKEQEFYLKPNQPIVVTKLILDGTVIGENIVART